MEKVPGTNHHNVSLDDWIDRMEDENIKRYIQHRIVDQMNWYKSQSRAYKKKYQCWMSVSIFIGSLIPIVSAIADGSVQMRMFIAALGSWGTAVSMILLTNNYKDLWIQYRRSGNFLLSTLYLYFNRCGEFRVIAEQRERDRRLVEICENYFINETQNWEEIKLKMD